MEPSGAEALAVPTTRTVSSASGEVITVEGFQQVLFIETGWGADQHGQNATKACVRAARNAIEFNSIPSIGKIVPGGYENMLLRIQIALPEAYHGAVDLDQVRSVFPYGRIISCELQTGGALFSSGIALEAMGDTSDAMIIAIVGVTVGY
ncbi:hypothetical protein M885DRAFT_505884 [Pelagophyceae sp. CCMP2097]|nr:hypothetical protein M885DRAFT_505884 [Pelagophyceae sp. CCMP2097]